MIEVKGIRKSFGEEEVLKGIDTTFYNGKTNLVIGQSGSGKTVFLKSLVGLYDIDAGEIEYNGIALGSLNHKDQKSLRTEMGMVFQGNALFDSLTILENVTFGLSMFSGMSESERNDRAQFCLERVNLPDVGAKFPSQLSGGMQKRVAIARAISMNPKYLFCDEPNSGLDPKTAIVIDRLLQEITQEFGMTTVINTHDMNSVIEIGDHIIFIKNGRKAWQGTGQEILNTENPEIVDFVYSSELFKKIRGMKF
jgi:phospholipid/cholesterol/gamma-HCH transport system ATP-binding protein